MKRIAFGLVAAAALAGGIAYIAPASGQAPKAKAWLSTGALPKSEGLGCVGCHK